MDKVVVKPWSWRMSLFSLVVDAAQWLLLYMWLAAGVQGAGNVVMAWNGFLAATGLLSVLVVSWPLRQATRPGPVLERQLSWASNVCFCLLMAWMGFWWMLVARLVARFGFFLMRSAEAKLLREQEVAHG